MPNVKHNFKGFIKLGIFLAFMIILIWAIFKIFVVPKNPATTEQVRGVLISQGYEPQDITEWYFKHDKNFKLSLIQCIAIEKDDIHFEFFVFNGKSAAVDVYAQFYSKISLSSNSLYERKTDRQAANYSIYTLDNNNTYHAVTFVENTVAYSYSKSENQNEVKKIFAAIDYIN